MKRNRYHYVIISEHQDDFIDCINRFGEDGYKSICNINKLGVNYLIMELKI